MANNDLSVEVALDNIENYRIYTLDTVVAKLETRHANENCVRLVPVSKQEVESCVVAKALRSKYDCGSNEC